MYIKQKDYLEKALFSALIENKFEFVRVILDHGVELSNFLTLSQHERLYSEVRLQF